VAVGGAGLSLDQAQRFQLRHLPAHGRAIAPGAIGEFQAVRQALA
jgi:hypothetical protein